MLDGGPLRFVSAAVLFVSLLVCLTGPVNSILTWIQVRIPVGYWMVATREELEKQGAPYVNEGIEYLDAAFAAAAAVNIDVLVCLHGAPGSQNGLQVRHANMKTSKQRSSEGTRTDLMAERASLL